MTHRVLNGVSQIATGTGPGDLALGAATSDEFQTMAAAGMNNGDTTYVRIENESSPAQWEIVLVTYSAGNITRTFDDKSESPTDNLISFGSGNKIVSSVITSRQVVTLDPNDDATIPGVLTVGDAAGTAETNNFAYTVATLAALKALTTRPEAVIVETGQAKGVWQWNVADSTAADDALVVNPTSGTAGRYKRIYEGSVYVTWFGAVGDGATDDGPAIQAAHDSVSAGDEIILPRPSSAYLISTTVTITKSIKISGESAETAVYIPSAKGFDVQAAGVTFDNLYFYGNRSASTSNKAIHVSNGSARLTLSNIRAELLNTFCHVEGGFFHQGYNLRLRNIVYAGFILDKTPAGPNGVEFIIDGIQYGTDMDSYAAPTQSFIWVKDFDGLVMSNYDLIWAGQVATVWLNPQTNRSGDHLFGQGYFDINHVTGTNAYSAPGLKIDPATGTTVDRCQVKPTWMATAERGIYITGAGRVFGNTFSPGLVFNHQKDGIYWDNTNTTAATNIFTGGVYNTNNVSAGAFSDIRFAVSGTGQFFNILGNVFNNGITSTSPQYNINFASGTVGGARITGNSFAYSNTSSGKVNGLSSTVIAQNNDGLTSWTTIGTITGAGAASYTVAIPSGYSELLLSIDGLTQSSAGDPQFGFSIDAGSNYLNVAQEQVQFATGSEARAAYISGGRSTTNAYQGTLHLVAPPAGFKHATYNSNEDASSSQGLLVVATIESTSEINLIRVAASAGNLSAGTVTVFGRI